MSPSNPTGIQFGLESDTELREKLNKLDALKAKLDQERTMAEMPKYKCHKEVWALKIKEVRDTTEPGNETDGSRLIIPEEQGFAPFRVDHAYVSKHKPQAGGYYVVYEDGYKSFSPAKAFEDGYTKI